MRVSIGSVRLFVEVFGQQFVLADDGTLRERPTLIGLHGGPGVDGTALRHWLAPLAEHARVVVPDLRGHGRSDRGSPVDWTLPTWAEDVRRLCVVLGIARPVLLGMSFGGFVAQQYAASYPGDLSGLVLLSTGPRYPADEIVLARVRQVAGDAAAAALERLIDDPGTVLSPRDLERVRSLYQRSMDPEAEALEAVLIRTPEVAKAWVPRARESLDLRPDLASVRCPTLAIVGEHDPFNPPSLAAETLEAMAGAGRLSVIPNAAHRVFTDEPDLTRAAIRDFLAAIA